MANGSDDGFNLDDLVSMFAGGGDTPFSSNEGLPNAGSGVDVSGDSGIPQTYGLIDNGDGTWTDPSNGAKYAYSSDGSGVLQSTGETDANYSPANGGIDTSGGTSPTAAAGKPTDLASLMKTLGPILAALGIGAGGYLANKATKTATNQALQGLTDSNAAINSVLGPGSGASSLFTPYTSVGAGAAAALPGAVFKPLTGSQFGPLAGKFGPLAGGFQPLGAGRGLTLGQLMQKG